MPQTFVKHIGSTVKERNSVTVTAYFRDSSNAASAPTTCHYRIDDISTHTKITDWTTVSPAVSVDITVKANENRIIANGDATERRQITVAADKGTTTETRSTTEWFVENIGGFDESSP